MIDVYVTQVQDTTVVVQGTAQAERFVFPPFTPDGPVGRVTINARGGDDLVQDASGQDVLNLIMGAGNDTLARVRAESDTIARLGPGDDIVAEIGAEFVLIMGEAGNDRIEDVSALEFVRVDGGTGDDLIWGSCGLDGGQLIGGDGADRIYGRGNLAPCDLFGGPGPDRLYGFRNGEFGGAEHFHFVPTGTPKGSVGRDTVIGFTQANGEIAGDKLLIDGDANRLRAGTQTYTFRGPGRTPRAGELMWFAESSAQIVVGFDGRTVFEIRLQGFRGTLTAADFVR